MLREDIRCLNLDGSSKDYNYEDYNYEDYNYDDYNPDNSLDNGCYVDFPYPHSDGYCYDYQEYNYDDYRVPVEDVLDDILTYDDWCFTTYGKYLDSNGYCTSALSSYTDYSDNKITWNIYDSKGNNYVWEIDGETYDDMIINGHDLSISNSKKPLYLITDYGNEISTFRYDGFVYGAFEVIIDDIYNNSDSNSDFIWEVWYIVSQMTVYDLDVDEESDGRYALETLVRQGGDCEDLVILIAEMLKSSSHTKDWDFQYVYLDSDNPKNPQTVNHVILSVYDGEYNHYIEATGEPSWDYYPNGVSGWRFDVL